MCAFVFAGEQIMMNLLSARWFRALAVIVLLVLLLWMSSNRIVVMLGNQ